MIVTLTLNPAIDRILSVDRLAFEDRSYINSTRESAGGRGINSSYVVHSFGAETLAVVPSGGNTGKRLETYLRSGGYRVAMVPIENEIRTNLTITDRQGLTVNLNEKGPKLGEAEVEQIERVVRRALSGAAWLMLCGSLPPGVPAAFYARLIGIAREKKVKTLLRAGGEALRQGIEASPTVAAPNQQEAERLLGRMLLTRPQSFEAAQQIRSMGPETVVISLGSRGAVGAFANGVYEAVPPRVEVVSPIGAGDALTAAYVWSMRRKPNAPDALRWAVAAGTASACLPGMNFATLDETRKIYRQVEVRRAE